MTCPAASPEVVAVTVPPPVARFNLRIAPEDLAMASDAFGLAIPSRIGQGAQRGDRAAYCIGPDEWLLHAPEAGRRAIVAAFDAVRAGTPHSLVTISDRELTVAVAGPAAMELLATGCPQDISRMAVGGARRTVFDHVQITLIRDGAHAFRLEVRRSCFPHVHGLLELAAREIAIGL